MAVSIAELLEAAHDSVWRAARRDPVPDRSWEEEATARAAGMAAAWPALAASADRAIRLLRPDSDPVYARVAARLREIPERSGVADADLARVATLLGVTGDAVEVTGRRNPVGESAPVDRVLAIVEAAAALTAPFAGLASGEYRYNPKPWIALASAARHATRTTPAERTSPATLAVITREHDPGPAAVLNRWHRAALSVCEVTRAPSSDLPLVASGMWLITAATADAAPDPTARQREQRWRAAVRVWGVTRIPGPAHPALREATADLRELIASTPSGGAAEALAAGDLHAVATVHDPALTVGYAAAVARVVGSGQVVVPARYLTAHTARPVPVGLARSAQTGRWVPLPAHSPPARDLLTAARSVSSPAAVGPVPTEAEQVSPTRASLPARPRPEIPGSSSSPRGVARSF